MKDADENRLERMLHSVISCRPFLHESFPSDAQENIRVILVQPLSQKNSD